MTELATTTNPARRLRSGMYEHPVAGDHHFPRYHVRPPSGFLNDPNGPVLVDGVWHVYYQYRPATDLGSTVMWGHVSSVDLATWTHHRIAISPDPKGPDGGGAWSGNTIATAEGIDAFYSAFQKHAPYQSVVRATSLDGGLSFGPAHVVVDDPLPEDGVFAFRDPFVWHEDGRFLMIVGAGDAVMAHARLYESADLENWNFRGVFAGSPREQRDGWDSGVMWECPQLVSFGDDEVLLVGSWSHEHGIMQVLALSGRRDGSRLAVSGTSLYDYGPNYYAASVARESEYGPIVWGWATEGRSLEWAVEADWSGMLTIPRVVQPSPHGGLASRPVPSLDRLRSVEPLAVVEPVAGSLTVSDLPAQFEVLMLLARPGGGGSTTIELRCSTTERLVIVVDWNVGTVELDRTSASDDARADKGRFVFHEPDAAGAATLELRWFIDGSISELFTSSGNTSTARFYPVAPPPWSLHVQGATAGSRAEVWHITGDQLGYDN